MNQEQINSQSDSPPVSRKEELERVLERAGLGHLKERFHREKVQMCMFTNVTIPFLL